MSYFEKIRDTVTTEVLKTYLPSLLLLLSGLLVAMIPQIRCTFLLLPPSLLLGLLAISLLGNSGTVAYVFILRKQKKDLQSLQKLPIPPLRTAFGFHWDDNDNPICPVCDIASLRPERVGTDADAIIKAAINPLGPKPQLECVKCGKKTPLVDNTGVDISLIEAKKKLPKRRTMP